MRYDAAMEDVLQRVGLTTAGVEAFCLKYQVARFELFGSVLRDDFDEQSDLDVLITFRDDRTGDLLDALLDMEDELAAATGRHVDVVERRLVEKNPNWIRRNAILNSAQVVYAAA